MSNKWKTLAFKSATPVTVNQFAFAVSSPTYLIQSAKFLHKELPIRIARRIRELESLPFGLSRHKSVMKILLAYKNGLNILLDLDTPDSKEKETIFTNRVADTIMLQNVIVVNLLSQALNDVAKSQNLEDASLTLVQDFVDSFVRSRLGLRLLCAQHLALHKQRKGWVGIVCTHCDGPSVVAEAVNDAQEACERALGVAPRVSIQGVPSQFRFAPSHLRYILFELLKNAMRAVVEFHPSINKSSDYPPIQVVVGVSPADEVCFRISDQGGGFARNTPVMSWVYSTGQYLREQVPEDDDVISKDSDFGEAVDMVKQAPFAGLGYGLPLARLYARYFNGDVKLFPMLNYGTDVYFHVKTFTQSNETLPI